MTTADPQPTDQKPLIAMRKDDESQFINVTTYWSLIVTRWAHAPDHPTAKYVAEMYELRVRHRARSEDSSFTFVSINAAERDDLELVSTHEWSQKDWDILTNDQSSCKVHMEDPDALPDIHPCPDCEAVVRANTTVWMQEHYRIMTAEEVTILNYLRATWDAFALLFNPVYNM